MSSRDRCLTAVGLFVWITTTACSERLPSAPDSSGIVADLGLRDLSLADQQTTDARITSDALAATDALRPADGGVDQADLGGIDACVPQPELCDNNADDNCNGVPDDPALCDVRQLITIKDSPHLGAWDATELSFEATLESSAAGKIECRWGKVSATDALSGHFADCTTQVIEPRHNPAVSGEGLYRTELRVAHTDGALSRVLKIDYYLHRSLEGLLPCPTAASDQAFFQKASQRLSVRSVDGAVLKFLPEATRDAPGAAKLFNPFVRVNFTPRTNRRYALVLNPGYAGHWTATDGKMELLSLRRRFTLNEAQTLLLMVRRYGSRRVSANSDQTGCNTITLSIHDGAYTRHLSSCHAVVLNREGAGVCLRVINGNVSFARTPNMSIFSRLANELLSPQDLPLVNGVTNAMWRKIAARHSPNATSTIDRSTCGPSNYSCGGDGVGRRYGWKHFSPKCYGTPSCVDDLSDRELKRVSLPGSTPLFLPDHRLYGL